MIIGEKKLKQLKKMPYIETQVSKSKDGKWIINKTTITSIKPVEYFETILKTDGSEEVYDTKDNSIQAKIEKVKLEKEKMES